MPAFTSSATNGTPSGPKASAPTDLRSGVPAANLFRSATRTSMTASWPENLLTRLS